MDNSLRYGLERDRRGIAETIVAAFWDQLGHLVNDQEAVISLLADFIIPGHFFVAADPEVGRVLGAFSFSDEHGYAFRLDEAAVKRTFGFIKGSIASAVLKDEFYRPAVFGPGQAHIDFVAVRADQQGRGLAKRMLGAFLQEKRYQLYTLEVVEGNERALQLYLQLGFAQTGRQPEKRARLLGFSFRYTLAHTGNMSEIQPHDEKIRRMNL